MISIPKTSPSRTIAAAMNTPFTPSAIRRPEMIAVRGTGAARSLSK